MVETMQLPPRRTEPLIAHLTELHKKDDRGPLAELRRGAADWPNCGQMTLRHVVRYFPEKSDPERENALLLVATLFSLNPGGEDPNDNIGAVMRKTAEARDSFDSIEARFMRLLGSRDEIEIATHLRYAVQLAAGQGVAVGWTQLLRDLGYLLRSKDDQRQRVLRKWAQSFWS